jgi:hypothetical protein
MLWAWAFRVLTISVLGIFSIYAGRSTWAPLTMLAVLAMAITALVTVNVLATHYNAPIATSPPRVVIAT